MQDMLLNLKQLRGILEEFFFFHFIFAVIKETIYRVTQKKRAPILIILNTRGPFFWGHPVYMNAYYKLNISNNSFTVNDPIAKVQRQFIFLFSYYICGFLN